MAKKKAKPATSKSKKSKTERIDFGGVPKERQQRGRHIPEGDYKVKIVSWKKGWKDDDKSNPPYYRWRFQVLEGKYKGTPLYYITSMKSEALFNLRNLIFAATDGAKNVAGKKVDFNPDSLVGKKIGTVVEDEEYEGKMRSRAVDVRPMSELDEEDDDEADDEDEDEESDEEDDEEDDEDEEDEDEEDDEEEDEDEDEDEEDLDEVDVEEI